MAFLNDYQYYENAGVAPESANWGSYQYISLEDIVKNFMMFHTGNLSLVNNEPRHKIIHFAKSAIRELNYDAFKEIKALELNVCEGLRYILPPDYVNWVRISWLKNGVLIELDQNTQAMTSNAYLQDNDCNILFDVDGNALSPEMSQLDIDRIQGTTRQTYVNPGHLYDGTSGYYYDGRWYFGGYFSLDTAKANGNPKFRIDNKTGVINFDSNMSDELVVLEYVSDGMEGGDDTSISVNKMFEKYLYASIKFDVLNDKVGVQEYIVRRSQKDRTALLRNAKIRVGDMHPGKLLMAFRGQDKIIK